jgi:hypothetical protein
MTEFLQSMRADLLSRRLLPFAALLALALVAALAYAVTGGSGGSAPAPVAQSAPNPSPLPALPVAVAPVNPHQAVSETPSGLRYQSHGPTRDPFVPLPTPAPPKTSSASSPASASGNSGSSSKGSSTGGTGSSGGSSSGGQKAGAPAPTPAPTAPKKPAPSPFPYIVSVLFGRASTTPGQPATLTPYEGVKLLQPLPSKQDALIALERVTARGDGAVFKLLVPPILHGSGICLPSTSECQTIDVPVAHVEELEYVQADGQVVVYELKVVSIAKRNAHASTAHAAGDAKPTRARLQGAATQAIGEASAVRFSGDGPVSRP